jgi:hypothetical protein
MRDWLPDNPGEDARTAVGNLHANDLELTFEPAAFVLTSQRPVLHDNLKDWHMHVHFPPFNHSRRPFRYYPEVRRLFAYSDELSVRPARSCER